MGGFQPASASPVSKRWGAFAVRRREASPVVTHEESAPAAFTQERRLSLSPVFRQRAVPSASATASGMGAQARALPWRSRRRPNRESPDAVHTIRRSLRIGNYARGRVRLGEVDAFDSLVVILDEVTDDLRVEHLDEDLAVSVPEDDMVAVSLGHRLACVDHRLIEERHRSGHELPLLSVAWRPDDDTSRA